jgi:hypothetical protein
VAVDAVDLLMRDGLPADRVVMHAMDRIKDQGDDDRLEHDLLALLGTERGGPGAAPAAPGPGRASLATLKSIMSEIRSPAFTGEVTLGILRFAGGLLARGALFRYASGFVTGMGQFGIEVEGETGDARVRTIKIPVEEPSVFHEVIEKRETFRGPLEPHPWNRALVRQLGGVEPAEVVAVPMLVGDRVSLVFYGDNAPGNRPLPPSDELELLMIQGGLAVEKALLEERVRALEGRKG